jgi:alanine-synthesizing transaminase
MRRCNARCRRGWKAARRFRADSGASAANLAELDRQLAQLPAVSRLEVEGGWYAVLRIPALAPDEQTVLALLERGVWVHPGYFFGMAGVGLAGGEPAGAGAGIQHRSNRAVDYFGTHQG